MLLVRDFGEIVNSEPRKPASVVSLVILRQWREHAILRHDTSTRPSHTVIADDQWTARMPLPRSEKIVGVKQMQVAPACSREHPPPNLPEKQRRIYVRTAQQRGHVLPSVREVPSMIVPNLIPSEDSGTCKPRRPTRTQRDTRG